jgi:hypothetical protein
LNLAFVAARLCVLAFLLSTIKSGEPFVYYRGAHSVGAKRGRQNMLALAALVIAVLTQVRGEDYVEQSTAAVVLGER